MPITPDTWLKATEILIKEVKEILIKKPKRSKKPTRLLRQFTKLPTGLPFTLP